MKPERAALWQRACGAMRARVGVGVEASRVLAAALALLAAFALAGCVAAEPPETDATVVTTPRTVPSESTATPEPLTDEEAIEIVRKAVTEYYEASQELLATGGESYPRLEAATTQALEESNENLLERARSENWSVEGSIVVLTVELSTIQDDSDGRRLIEGYACLDASRFVVKNSNGEPLHDANDSPLMSVSVAVVLAGSDSRLSRSETWQGNSVC